MTIVYAVRHVMSKPVITADKNTPANEGIELMVQKDIGALAVVANAEFVGVVTERDIMKNCCGKKSCEGTKLGEIMSAPIVTIDADAPIGSGVEMMASRNIRRLMVTEKGKIVGIVTQKDLLKGTLQAFQAMHLASSAT